MEYENKKDTPFTNLLANVKKQMAEEEADKMKVKK
jgi:hypothetical protein